MAKILVGTSSWTAKTLIESGKFYLKTATTPEDRLRYYASQFPIVEIDSSYYGIPSIENAERWVERRAAGLVFNIKTYRLFTRHQTPVVSLGKDVREKLGEVAKKNVYEKDLPPAPVKKLWGQFRDVLEVLRHGGKLGAVHMQFAPWVTFHAETSTTSSIAARCWLASRSRWSFATPLGSTATSTPRGRWSSSATTAW
jgi:uncharacterized protein YecE (DUF72 family)